MTTFDLIMTVLYLLLGVACYLLLRKSAKNREIAENRLRETKSLMEHFHPETVVGNAIIKDGVVYVPQQSVEKDGDICEQCGLWQKGCKGACNVFGKGLIMKERE